MFRRYNGFTLTEFIIGVFLLTLALGFLLPNFGCNKKDDDLRVRAREAEVKSNIHTIQIALERYAVDTGGLYPLILYGGDRTDTCATHGSYTSFPPIDDPEYSPFPGDIDVLLEFGYLSQYPENPFYHVRDVGKYGKIITNPGENGFDEGLELKPGRVNIWARPRDRGTEYIKREVGGEQGNLMWDISEGQRHPPWPVIMVPPPEPSPTGFVNPDPGIFLQNAKEYDDDYQFWLTPGNFYYYAIFDGVGCYSTFIDKDADGEGDADYPVVSAVIGYRLAGYGAITNPGKDYYNLWGDYPERSLFTMNNPARNIESQDDLYVGPDGRPDGVILMLSSVVDIGDDAVEESEGSS